MTRIRRLSLALVAGVIGLSMVAAHADTTVAFTTQEGAQLKSLPVAPDGSQLGDAITGTATDETAVGGVHVQVEGPMVPNPNDPGGAPVPLYDLQNDAVLSCNAGATSCTWSYQLPFVMFPGDYKATATAVDFDGNTATASIGISVL